MVNSFGITDIDRTGNLRAGFHQPDHALNEVVDIAERARLAAVAIDGDRLAL